MRINLHFENDGMPETAEAWLLDLLSRHSIQRVEPSILTGRGEQLPLLGPGHEDWGSDGGQISLIQILCTSILRASTCLDVLNGQMWSAVQQPRSLSELKVGETASVDLVLEGQKSCQVSISFSLEL